MKLLLLVGFASVWTQHHYTLAFSPLPRTPTSPLRTSTWKIEIDPQQSIAEKKRQHQRHSLSFLSDQSSSAQRRVPFTLFAMADDSDTSKPIKLIIAGAPASGKGTQCEQIKSRYGLVHLSTGDMLREAVAAGTSVGKKAKEYMDSGKLVPDEVIIGVIRDRLAEDDCQTKGWLLDGFPRTQAQAKALEECGAVADCFIFLNVPDEILVERVVGRRTDPETGKIYHMTFSPPSDESVVARLVHRSDDTEEKVKVRLEQFHANVDAVSDSYQSISVTIDGNQAPQKVTDAIFTAVSKRVGGKVGA